MKTNLKTFPRTTVDNAHKNMTEEKALEIISNIVNWKHDFEAELLERQKLHKSLFKHPALIRIEEILGIEE